MFYGYYLSAAVMVKDEQRPAVPELARRITVCSSAHDPAAALAGVLTSMPAGGIALGDILADSGYSHRVPATWANPLRRAGASLVQDLHPNDRGPQGTHHGAIIANGYLYCPATPKPLLQLVPLPPGASRSRRRRPRPSRPPSSPATSSASTPATTPTATAATPAPPSPGRSAARSAPQSMKLDRSRPEILTPPQHPPACCTQQTITVRPAGRRQDPAEARLPLAGMADLLPAAHRRRTAQRHHQGHRHQQHRPRLDPPHRPHPAHALAGLPDRRPQPAHPGRLPGPPARRHHAAPPPAPAPQPASAAANSPTLPAWPP